MPKLILPRNPNSIANLNPKTLIFTPKLRTLSSSSSSSSQLQSKPKSHPETNLSSPTNDQITQLILEQKSPIELFKTFKWASNLPNFTHNQSSYRAMIHKLCIFRRFDNAHQLLDEMPDSIGCPPDEGVFVTLVRGLGRGKRVREVIRVPELMRKFGVECSLKVFNSILNVLVAENIDVAREFFRKKIIEAGFVGDDYTYGIMMKGFSLTNRIDDGYKLLELMKSRGLKPNVVIYNTMMHSLCKHGKVEKARKLMDEIVEPSDVTYNLMISAYCKEGIAIEAQVLLEKSIASGFVPDVVSTTKVVDLLCNLGRVIEAADVLERVESVGGVVDDVAYNTLIKGFCSIRKPKVGLLFKKQMENKRYLPNTETYNILIAGFFDVDLLDMAADLFNEMKRAAINRNFVTYDTMIKGFCSKGRVEDAFEILEEMEESKGGSGGRISPYNSIIYGLYREKRGDEALDFLNKLSKMFPRMVDRTLNILALCKDGNLESAKAVYEKMLHEGGFPSVLVYNSLIQGFAKYKHFNEAFRLMNEMVDRGFFPVALTYNAVISGFCEFGKIESALHFTGDLKEKGLPLDVGSYSPFIFAICDKGDLQEAFEIFQLLVDKGIRPDYSIWTSMVHCLNRETNWLEPDNLALLNNRIQVILET